MEQNQLIKHSRKWDFGGVIMTILCLIHCLFFPVLSATVPHWFFFNKSLFIEFLLFIPAIFIGIFSLTTSFLKHRKIYPMILGFLGLILLAFSIVHHQDNISVLHTSTTILNPLGTLGSFLLISGHLWNIHICHCFCNPDCTHEEHQKS